jgi:hypothetical protein
MMLIINLGRHIVVGEERRARHVSGGDEVLSADSSVVATTSMGRCWVM